MTEEQATRQFQELGERIGAIVEKAVKEAFIMQGHDLTGELNRSIHHEVKAVSSSAEIEFRLLNYGMVLNYGVKPERIPFNAGSGAKGSKYIDGLKTFAKLRFGADDKTATSIAFAIAHKHKKFGMPINKTKTGAITNALENVNDKVVELINEAMGMMINFLFIGAFTEVEKKDSKNIKIEIKL